MEGSASVPVGLYRLRPISKLVVTHLIAIQPHEPLAALLDDGGFLPCGMSLLKRVSAPPGQTVCGDRLTIPFDNIEIGEGRERESLGRSLPVWQGCRVIAEGEVFLMNWQSAASLDGRYFGALLATAIVGQRNLSWTKEGD